ncbi:unnamed protein product [Lactuca saligna]|uniref:Transmembrane protein n=1 Tax=Lactuca saligna TaxID=75948 RepID=A0AA35ZRL7_LACSI|nr:unnamed protein product [Lactuca saligna]
MPRLLLLFLILTHTFLTLASPSAEIEPSVAGPPQTAEAPRSRKLGNHHVSESDSEPPSTATSRDHEGNGGSAKEESGMYLEKQHQHHHGSGSVDKSIAGGGVILGGLVMAFVVSIVCYIRATRRRSMVEPPTPTTVRGV